MAIQKLNKYLFFSAIISLLLLTASCSTKKNTATRRAYHNLTCHYNVWWNGDVSLDEGVESLKTNVKDNYNMVLPVYNYGTKQEALALNPKMDRTIKKASIAIQRHSMSFGGKEYVKWIDDSYLMMGKAHFNKQDYTSARRVFDYIAKEYTDKPIHYEGYLWLAKTYIATERFEKAEATLNLMYSEKDENELPKSVIRDLPLVYADFFIAQENYEAAYPYLERGLELGNKKYILTRVEFALGQINQLEGDLKTATAYYNKVIKRNPDYKMAFEARINMAQCYDEGTGDSKYITKVLKKMAKDAKNKEFLDQIYYALAEVALKDQNDTLAIHYLRESVSVSTTDNYQKSTSALVVADIFFEQGDYQLSQAYYDTASSVLPLEYPNYDAIKNKAGVLSELVIQVQTIYDQDSLQRMAALDTNDLFVVIDKIIADYKKEEERKRIEAKEMEEQGIMFMDPNRGKSNNPALGDASGKWYFYNTTAMSFGYSEFIKQWGNRKLEDNWRLTDKRMVMETFEEEEVAYDEDGNPIVSDTSQLATTIPTDPRKRDYYIINIPRTEEQIAASTEMIIESYNRLGYLYIEELEDTTNARETYLEFLEKYPDNKYQLQSWYALYKIYEEEGDFEKMTRYKNLIVTTYPDSDFAKVLLDPDYFMKLSEQKNLAAQLYEKTYKAYIREQYFRVITYANKGIEQYPEDTAVIPRLMYLRAISLGKVDVPDTMYVAINELVREYPSSPVIPRAKAVLRVLQSEYGIGEPLADDEGAEGAKSKGSTLYTYQPDEMHLLMMVVISEDIKIDPLKVRISDFKNKYFRLARLRIKSLMLDNQRTVITVGNFDDASDAEDFVMALKNDEYVLSGMEDKDFDIVSISMKNYPIFYKEKNTEDYIEFYQKKYQNEKK